MKLTYFLPLFLIAALASCGGESEEEVVYDEQEDDAKPTADYAEFSKECEALEQQILAAPVPDKELMREGIIKFQDFAGFFPDKPEAPDYLLKASDYSLQLQQPEKSVKILDRIIKEYPDYEKMIDVKYSRASQLDYELRDTTRAKEAYQDIIDNYPTDNRANDARMRIKYIRYGFDDYSEMIVNGEIEPIVQ